MKKIFLVVLLLINLLLISNVQAASNELKNTQNKVDHLVWSIKNNYLGLKNQAQWEEYVKEFRTLIKSIPNNENLEKIELSAKVDKIESLVKAIARINHVEKSIETNYHGIKNAKQWNEYITLAEEDLEKIDKKVFLEEYDALIERKNVCKTIIEEIEKEFYKEYTPALEKYIYARENMLLKEAREALELALPLGSCDESDLLKEKAQRLINEIETVNITINSVDVKEGTFDDDTKAQELKLIVNGDVISKDFVKSAGYSINFKAFNSKGEVVNIFEDNSRGVLKSKLDKSSYRIAVTLNKYGIEYTSKLSLIDIANLDGSLTSIEDYTLKNFGKESLEYDNSIDTKTLLVGEKAKISSLDVVIDGDNIKLYDDIRVKVKNVEVIELQNGYINAKKSGKAIVNISYGEKSKDFEIEVKRGERELTFLKTEDTINVISGKTIDLSFSMEDNYGDPYNYTDFAIGIQSSSKVKSTKISYKGNGEGVLTIAGGEEGLSDIYIKTKDGKVLKTITVNVSKIDNIATTKLEIMPNIDYRYSNELTIYPEGSYVKKYIDFYLGQYNSENIFNGKVNLKDYSIKYDERVLNVSNQENGVFKDCDSFTVSANITRDTDIHIFYPNGAFAYKATIKVLSLGYEIEKANFKNIENVDYSGEKINLFSVLDGSDSGNDGILTGIKLKKETSHKIRVSKDESTKGYIYIDKDSNGKYNTADILLGEIKAKVYDNENSGLSEIDIYDGVTTKKGDNLTVLFTINIFENGDSEYKELLENKFINVEVK